MAFRCSFYDMLRLSPSCSPEEIRKAYKKLVLVYHPDKIRSNGEKFKLINKAYRVLSDPEERRTYDEKRSFESEKSADTVVDVKVTLEELYCGTIKTVTVVRERFCYSCLGIDDFFSCPDCHDRRKITEERPVRVSVEKGHNDGIPIRLIGKGGQELGRSPGDLVVNVWEKKHSVFKRVRYNLLMHVKLSITEALCGFTKTIETLDGRLLMINEYSGRVTKPGTLRCVLDEGMPVPFHPELKGRLIIKFYVKYPDQLDPSAIRRLESALPPRSPVHIPTAPDAVTLHVLKSNTKYLKLFDDAED